MKTAIVQAPSAGWKYRVWSETTGFIQVIIEVLPFSLWLQYLAKIPVEFGTTLLTMLIAISGINLLAILFQYTRIHLVVRLSLIFAWMGGSILVSYRVLYNLDGGVIPFILNDLTQTGSAAVMLPLLMMLAFTWRVVTLASRMPEASTLGNTVQFQLILILLFGIAYPKYSLDQGLTTFYIVLLLAVIASMTRKIASLGELHGGRLPFIDLSWALWLGATAVFVLAVGMLMGWLFQGRLSIWLGQATLVLVLGVISLIGIALSPALILMFMATNWLSNFYATATGNAPMDLMGTDDFDRIFEGEVPRENLDPILKSLEPYLWAALVVLMLIAIAWMVRRQIILRAIKVEGDISSAVPGMKTRKPQPLAQQIRERLMPSSLYNSVRVRWIYAQLSRLGNRLDAPRPPAATPQEYLPDLIRLFPDHQDGLALITSAYQAVRYGHTPEDSAMIDAVDQHWKQIRQSGSAALRQRRRKRDK